MINIKNLRISYDDKDIIKGLNLDFKKNSITAIVGESGTGKTSLALALMGLNKNITNGEIIVNNENILNYNKEDIRNYRWSRTSIVFQNSGDILNPKVKIFKQIAESMIEHNFCSKLDAYKRAKKLILDVGLDSSYYNVYPFEMSGGQIQKVLIAMALANDPDILIFDEFTASLDPLTKIEMINLIKRVAKNKTIILITHDFSVANSLADNIVVLYAGVIVEYGNASEILKNPVHPYTRALLRSYPNMSTTKDLQSIRGSIELCEKGCPFVNRCTQSIGRCFCENPELKYTNNRAVACHRNGSICIIKANKVTKKYKKKIILDEVDFELYEGETLAVVGESGSGKTTLAKCIMGLENIDSGELFFSESENFRRNKDFYKKIQIIYQNPKASINKNFDVFTAVKEPLDIYHIGTEIEKKQMVLDVLLEVNLPIDENFLNSFPYELSGGECQRVSIARSLILKPKVLIADEVTSALDVSVQAKIMKLFMELQEKRGLTLFFITHDIALARKISDKLMVIKNGTVVEYGNSASIINNPISEYTRKLIEAGSRIF